MAQGKVKKLRLMSRQKAMEILKASYGLQMPTEHEISQCQRNYATATGKGLIGEDLDIEED